MTVREPSIETDRAGMRPALLAACLLATPVAALAAQTFNEDLIVTESACIGPDCTEDSFPFDTLRLHGPDPLLSIRDESNDGSPANDWSLGITDNGAGGASHFFIRDETTGSRVLWLDVNGAVALGAGAELVNNAVSIGAMGNERRVAHVADAEEPTDAVNLRQFEEFQQQALGSVDKGQLQEQLDSMSDRIDSLAARVEDVAAQVQ